MLVDTRSLGPFTALTLQPGIGVPAPPLSIKSTFVSAHILYSSFRPNSHTPSLKGTLAPAN
jgi:hypothetical protein